MLKEVLKVEKVTRTVPVSEPDNKIQGLKKRLAKAGYEYDEQRLISMTSIMDGLPTFLNVERLNLEARKAERAKSLINDARVIGVYETTIYLTDRAYRYAEIAEARAMQLEASRAAKQKPVLAAAAGIGWGKIGKLTQKKGGLLDRVKALQSSPNGARTSPRRGCATPRRRDSNHSRGEGVARAQRVHSEGVATA